MKPKKKRVKKIVVYEADINGESFTTTAISDILGWMETELSDMETGANNSIQCEIIKKRITQRQYSRLPEYA